MSTNVVEIDQVKPDIDDFETGTILNPLAEDFTHAYGGRAITVPAGKKVKAYRFVKTEVENEKTGKMELKKKKEEYEKIIPGEKQMQLPIAVHVVNHLAQKIVRAKHRAFVGGIKDEKKKEIESSKPIPDYKGKVWKKMKELTKTDSNFFDDVDEHGKSNEEKFVS